jgi:hypothetical protein
MTKFLWFFSGLFAGLTALSISKASVVKESTAISQSLSEIHVKKERKLDFSSDIRTLSLMENDRRFQERLPVSKKR